MMSGARTESYSAKIKTTFGFGEGAGAGGAAAREANARRSIAKSFIQWGQRVCSQEYRAGRKAFGSVGRESCENQVRFRLAEEQHHDQNDAKPLEKGNCEIGRLWRHAKGKKF